MEVPIHGGALSILCCLEPLDAGTRTQEHRLQLFHFSGVPFFSLFSCTHFFDKKPHLSPTGPQKWLPNPSQTWPWTYFFDFQHTLFLLPCAVFLIVSTVPTCSKTHKKQHKNKALKTQWKSMMISLKKQEIFRKRLSNGVPKSEGKLGKCHFGASGGTSGASGRFFTQKM